MYLRIVSFEYKTYHRSNTNISLCSPHPAGTSTARSNSEMPSGNWSSRMAATISGANNVKFAIRDT